MNAPNQLLMRAYGTEDVYQAKLAGGSSFYGPMAAGLASYQWARNRQGEIREQRRQAEIMNQMFRHAERQKMQPADEALEFTPMPYSTMTRLASIAAEVGGDMAKRAGIGDFASSVGKLVSGAKGATQAGGLLQHAGSLNSLKWKLPLAAAGLGAAALTAKGVKGGLNYMSQEAQPKNWGVGPSLAYGVNQYGQPQVGSSFQG